jgi:hypothetical protein
VLALTLTMAPAAVFAQGVTIEQEPSTSSPINNDEANIKSRNEGEIKDYQNQILSNPVYSAPARVNSLTDGNIMGNTAIIKQNGKSNKSSITQEGDDNYARQSQEGNSNDIRVEQQGKHNRSDEQQKGNYNRKVKIQNGNREETITIEQVSPTPNDKP